MANANFLQHDDNMSVLDINIGLMILPVLLKEIN